MRKVLFVLPPMLFAGLATLFWIGMNRDDPDRLPSAMEGHPAPAVAVVPLGAAPVLTQGDLTAPGVKIVNFWASWCAPCRAEHPTLKALAAQGVVVHGVNYKDKPAAALGFLDEMGSPYVHVGADESGRMGLDWGLYGVPETFVIDGKGTVVLRFPGPVTERVMQDTILPAIAKAAAG